MIVRWLGTVEYAAAWRLQEEIADLRLRGEIDDALLLVEHAPTLTLGRSANKNHLLLSRERLTELGVGLHEVDRGGDITYHGPGQLVGYPIFDLSDHGKDLHQFLRNIEGALIDALAVIGLVGQRFPPHTGVWIEDRKVAAVGVKVRRWVSTHGFALNVKPDMSHFEWIVPCGIADHGVTSIYQEGKQSVSLDDMLPLISTAFRSAFPATRPREVREGELRLGSAESQVIWGRGAEV